MITSGLLNQLFIYNINIQILYIYNKYIFFEFIITEYIVITEVNNNI